MQKIKATPANRKQLRIHAREAMAAYSAVMTWLIKDGEGNLYTLQEPQGQSHYVGSDDVIATTGGFHKAHGDGAAIDPSTGRAYRVQRDYLIDLLGAAEYHRIFQTRA